MNITVKEINEYTRELNIDISWDELEADFNTTVKEFGKKVKIPGFRPGKVPKDKLMKQYQPNIEADFMENNFQKYYAMALQQEDLMPVNQAEIKDVHFHFEAHFSFLATFEIEPEIVLPKMKKNMLKVQKTTYISDDQDLEDAIVQLQKSKARIETVEDGAVEGDFIVCDLQKLDESGVPIIGKKFENQYLKVGHGSFTDDQKDKLIGLKADETARLTIPENKEGQLGDYDVTVTNVEREVLPEVNMDFVKLVDPDSENEEAFRQNIREKINENFSQKAAEVFERDITDAFIEKTNPVYPPSMVESYLNNLVEDVKKKNQGEPLDEAQVKETYHSLAERNLKWYLVRKSLMRQEELTVTPEETSAEVDRLVERTPASDKEIRKFYKKPSNLRHLEDDLMEKKILEVLKQFAKVKEVDVQTNTLRGETGVS
ncbi:MAG: trigger factor [Candidatus Marinimicrobia bacterium]|nr:trigger factor [Candidatus Neomarinimicrobiota bacterium]MBT3937358.1 trigger factor [Candidatus Neomarinimicrobiota bacterium]MBT3960970.1 trigger factor [Candidatus Neomarinimicrobiota bacterium]MBT4382314.1 trigger factor [Candidatus Neomarinimicrobiota bacterium]MBT4636943.1 trigger factor [Candidatus Neomarinimicrobiota bacterium]